MLVLQDSFQMQRVWQGHIGDRVICDRTEFGAVRRGRLLKLGVADIRSEGVQQHMGDQGLIFRALARERSDSGAKRVCW